MLDKNQVNNRQIQEKILSELQKGDRFAGELKDACGANWTQFWKTVSELENQGKIFRYFRDRPPSARLCFTVPARKRKSLSTEWSKHIKKGIKPWSYLGEKIL